LNLDKRSVNITRIKNSEKTEELDVVLIESPLDIIVNSESIVSIICLPNFLEELALGFLFSIGIINSIDEIEKTDLDNMEGKIHITLKKPIDIKSDMNDINPISRVIDTTCGLPSPWRDVIKGTLEVSKKALLSKNSIKLKSDIIFSSIIRMQKETKLFRETGGCHGAAIFNIEGELLTVKEDIGRHNAIDKVIGDLLKRKHNFKNIFLTTTGRLTGDSVLKAIRAKIPIVASLSAAIESGIRLAFAYGITLIGFVRGKKMNIYTHSNQVLL